MSQHAIYSPSSAKRWMKCTASAEAIAQLPPQEESEAAAEGTEAHEEIERILGPYHNRPNIRLDADALLKVLDRDHPAAYGIALLLKYVAGLDPGQFWIEQRVELTKDIWGRCDVAHFDPVSEVLTIVDYKNGHGPVDAEENEQTRIYAAASLYTHNLPAKWIRHVIVQPNDWRPGIPRVKQWTESAESLFQFAQRAAAVPASNLEFKAGGHCRYCPLFGRCEPTKDLLTHLSVALQHVPEEVPMAARAAYLTLQKPLEDWFKSASKVWTKELLAGKAAPGLKLVAVTTKRTWRSPEEAKEQILETLGVNALEVPTPAQAEKLGMDKAWVDEHSERPDGGPALAFESDKRPAFQRASVEKMFARVVGK